MPSAAASAVVVNFGVRRMRYEFGEIQLRLGIALADLLFRDGMVTRRNASLDTCDMQIGGRQPAEPDQDVVRSCSLQDLGRHCLAAKCCFEDVVQSLRDGFVRREVTLRPARRTLSFPSRVLRRHPRRMQEGNPYV